MPEIFQESSIKLLPAPNLTALNHCKITSKIT